MITSIRPTLYLLLLIAIGWCTMTMTHELGLVLAGWAGGGGLKSADLRPWRLPYSVFQPDPHPLVTLWAGPVSGCLLPLGLAVVLRRNWSWLVAYFCLLANGLYLATGWLYEDSYLDTAKLLKHGAPPVAIILFCLVTISVGYVGFRRSLLILFAGSDSSRQALSEP